MIVDISTKREGATFEKEREWKTMKLRVFSLFPI